VNRWWNFPSPEDGLSGQACRAALRRYSRRICPADSAKVRRTGSATEPRLTNT